MCIYIQFPEDHAAGPGPHLVASNLLSVWGAAPGVQLLATSGPGVQLLATSQLIPHSPPHSLAHKKTLPSPHRTFAHAAPATNFAPPHSHDPGGAVWLPPYCTSVGTDDVGEPKSLAQSQMAAQRVSQGLGLHLPVSKVSLVCHAAARTRVSICSEPLAC